MFTPGSASDHIETVGGRALKEKAAASHGVQDASQGTPSLQHTGNSPHSAALLTRSSKITPRFNFEKLSLVGPSDSESTWAVRAAWLKLPQFFRFNTRGQRP